MEEIRKEEERCRFCRKRTILLVECKCGAKICLKHRMPSKHNCDFDWEYRYRNEILNTKLVKLVPKKIMCLKE